MMLKKVPLTTKGKITESHICTQFGGYFSPKPVLISEPSKKGQKANVEELV